MFFYRFQFFRSEAMFHRRKQLNQLKIKQVKKKKERKRCISPYKSHFLQSPQSYERGKRISIFLFSKKQTASMTVEAACVLPLFLFAFINILSVVEIYRLQSNLSMAMYHAVKEMAVYGHAYTQFADDDRNHLESYGLTYLYGAGRVKSCLEDAYCKQLPIEGGYTSIQWMHSKMMQNQCIDLVATYKVKPMIGLMGFTQFPMYNRMRTRAWTGYDIPLVQEAQEQEKMVYVTPEGEAYHISKSCQYLRLSIRAVSRAQVGALRNQDREKYMPCQQCSSRENRTVFITLFGNKYHTSLQCGGLKRTILSVPVSKVGTRHLCQKCGG